MSTRVSTRVSTHLGLSSGSGSFRASPAWCFSASSASIRCSSASTFPCKDRVKSRHPIGSFSTTNVKRRRTRWLVCHDSLTKNLPTFQQVNVNFKCNFYHFKVTQIFHLSPQQRNLGPENNWEVAATLSCDVKIVKVTFFPHIVQHKTQTRALGDMYVYVYVAEFC